MLRKDRNRKTNRKQSRTVSAAVLAVLLAGSLACGSAASEVTELAETEAEASADAQYANVKEFLSDIEAAVNDRRAISDSYTEAELRCRPEPWRPSMRSQRPTRHAANRNGGS